ncbi:maleylpyruvate isomerase family mycothiol-dependent enzyme [Mycolicibacterium elephantis]|uniref:maleylpyruvate isomerase family mycothiol-dependent enzyme n=1 Tax=Mycolicibacterium elephantis TaxID=81858 RepID=UPI000FE24547|nr:maleylpyruvate isomerase family mycothiol-dependent enzyme [Mycolicibacterium elephantis]MCV7222998.1 maleylpyruvate isomerase family mycothiol-dependent enzyme [Mycolicibacterium elephantis]
MSTPRQPTILDKSAVLTGLFAVWDDIAALAAGLDDAQWEAPTPLPGWSVRDVVAHLIGVESMLQGVETPDADVDVSTLEHVRNDIGAMNERWVRGLRQISPAELLERFRAVTADRREALTALSEDDWNAVTMTPAGPDSYGRFMRVRVFDCWMHEHDIRDAIGQPVADAELARPAAELSLDEMAASMGFVVGKLGGAPDGARVSIELTGPLGRTINVAVAGRAQVVDDFGGEPPTSTIRLDGLLFTRLAGGRTPLDHDAIAYGGDEAVGRRIVEHLNYVI